MSEHDEWVSNPESILEPGDEETIQEETTEAARPEQPKIDLNQAKATELRKLPGIGRDLAARIVHHRTETGPFKEPAEITQVRGISRAMYERIAERLTVGPEEPESWSDWTRTSEVEIKEGIEAEVTEEPEEEVSEPPEVEQFPEPAPEVVPDRPQVKEAPSRGPEPPLVEVQTIHKAGWGWMVLVGLVSALLGASLALSVLFLTNGTLNFQASANRALQAESFRLQGEVDILDGQLATLEERLKALQDLTPVVEKARADIQSLGQDLASAKAQIDIVSDELATAQASLAGLENRTGAMEEQVSTLQAQAGVMQEQLAVLTADVEKLQGATARFDAFLNGLRELLSTGEEATSPQLTPMPTPEAEESPTAEPAVTVMPTVQPRITVIPLATPTPTPSP